MFNIIAKPIHAPNKTLGVGTYYEKCGDVLSLKEWVAVRLERPLVLNERKVLMLGQEYATNSDNPVVAMSGAWKLRRDLMRQGYDGVIAVIAPGRVRIVQFRRLAVEGSVSETRRDRSTVIKFPQKEAAQLASVRLSAGSLSTGGVETVRRV